MEKDEPLDPLRPIFGEVPEDVTEDWNHGILLGGMAVCDEHMVAMAYKEAGDMLVEKALDSGDRSWAVAYPIIFLYRHAIELQLKLIARPRSTDHELPDLISQVDEIAQAQFGSALPDWVKERISEIAHIDPRSTSFRYGDLRARRHLMQLDESWVDLPRLKKLIDTLVEGFKRLA